MKRESIRTMLKNMRVTKSFGRRVVALGLSAMMVATMLPNAAMARVFDRNDVINQLNTSSATVVDLSDTNTSAKSKLAQLSKTKVDVAVDSTEKVVFIVEVNTASMLDEFAKSKESDVSEFIEANAAKEEQIKTSVEVITDNILATVKGTKVVMSYDTVLAGAAISAQYGDREAIEAVKGVKSVSVSKTYDAPDPIVEPGDSTNMKYSREIVGAGAVQSGVLDFKGQGMVVAIVDTGISYLHDAFSLTPEAQALTAEDINALLQNNSLSAEAMYTTATGKVLTGTDVFKSNKVPFGFDYTDFDTNPIPTNEENHGTHVAGTVAGNCASLQGIAPEAQLLAMKVFNDKGSTSDEALIAAIGDAVVVGADVINMSLGSTAGFETEPNPALAAVYASVEASGVNLDVSAGNEGENYEDSAIGGLNFTINPDTSTVGSPSTLSEALSVASMENDKISESSFLQVGSLPVGYTDNGASAEGIKTTFDSLGVGNYQYVNCGLGEETDVETLDLTGKVALVQRGAISFSDKMANVADKGAIAMVLYNNTTGTIGMSISDYMIPGVSITKADGLDMVAAIDASTLEGTFSYDPEARADIANPTAGEMSSFTSWGPTPSMQIKPEITAPGGNIYSSYWVNEDGTSQYGIMSGTSMSCPHLSGLSALVKQYVKADPELGILNAVDSENMVNTLLMSTAAPIIEGTATGNVATENFYSPRRQGSGLANVEDAVTTNSYLSVNNSVRPKAELGSNADGDFTFDYTIHNMKDTDQTYSLSGAVLVPEYMDGKVWGNSTAVTANYDRNVTDNFFDITFTVDSSTATEAIVSANASKIVHVTITKKDGATDLSKYEDIYSEGYYVEGFVFATATGDVEVSAPFLGYNGDWGDSQVMDTSRYAELNVVQDIPTLGSGNVLYNDGPVQWDLGSNNYEGLYMTDADKANVDLEESMIAVSPYSLSGTTAKLATSTYLLRGAKKVVTTFKNSEGDVISSTEFKDVSKSTYNTDYSQYIPYEWYQNGYGTFDGYDSEGNLLPNGQYSVTITASPACEDSDSKSQSQTTQFTLDSQKPAFDNMYSLAFVKNGHVYVQVKVYDNDYLAGYEVSAQDKTTGDFKVVANQFCDHTKADTTDVAVQTFDLGTVESFETANLYLDSFNIEAYDYAMNVGDTTLNMDMGSLGVTLEAKAGSVIIDAPVAETGYTFYYKTMNKVCEAPDMTTTDLSSFKVIDKNITIKDTNKVYVEMLKVNNQSNNVVAWGQANIEPKQMATLVSTGNLKDTTLNIQYTTESPEIMKIVEDAIKNEAALQGFMVGDTFEINLSVDGITVTESKDMVTFRIDIPADLQKEGRTFRLINIHDGSVYILQDEDDDDSTITVTTNHFSPYILVYTDLPAATLAPVDKDIVKDGVPITPVADNTPDTGDTTDVFGFIALMVAGIGMVLFGKKKLSQKW